MGSIMSHEAVVRLGCFVAVFVVMAMWEIAAPRRRLRASKGSRWFANLGILVVRTIVVRVIFPGAAAAIRCR